MPKCTINGQEIEVEAGTSIIEAYKMIDQNIAHYCWHPGLSVAGVCRLCMVEIEGMPKLQIACNTEIRDGMVINNNSEKVKETVRWGLDFHLINHPLDCPICDQAGECGLQDQYMEYGKYDPEMAVGKVKKKKVVDLGPTVVLDSERCILCSRCVRFTDEVSQTNELGIFNRGDRSEIGTHSGKPLDNSYSLNTVDICPVGALTSKDFRFRQRVWYLEETESICNGCSTGCNVKNYHNEEGLWRVKPRHNEKVNGHWMCDEGRNTYKHVNREARLERALVGQKGQWAEKASLVAAQEAQSLLSDLREKNGGDAIAFVLTGQLSNEENESVRKLMDSFGASAFHWKNNEKTFEEFDGLLLRGDKNPNTAGLLETFQGSLKPWSELDAGLASGKIRSLVVFGPEIQSYFPEMDSFAGLFSKSDFTIWLTSGRHAAIDGMTCQTIQLPLRTTFEKKGSFTNFAGVRQEFPAGPTLIPESLTAIDLCQILQGQTALDIESQSIESQKMKANHFTGIRGDL